MYENFWTYAIFVVVFFVAVNYLTKSCLVGWLDKGVIFVVYLLIAFIVASSMRYTLSEVEEGRERTVRLSFDVVFGLLILVSAFCRLGGMEGIGNFGGKSVKAVKNLMK